MADSPEEGATGAAPAVFVKTYRRPQKDILPPPEKAYTQHLVTVWLLATLAGTVLVYFLLVWYVLATIEAEQCREAALRALADGLGKILPAEVGLVGAATAFYFSHRD